MVAAGGVQIGAADPDDGGPHAGLAGVGYRLWHRLDDHVVEPVDHDAPIHGRTRHHAVYPPSATSTEPVMNEAASLARNTTLGAISSGMA